MSRFVEKMKRSAQHPLRRTRSLLDHNGFRSRQRGGSHVVYKREDGTPLIVERPYGGKNFVNQQAVVDVLRMFEAEDETDGDADARRVSRASLHD